LNPVSRTSRHATVSIVDDIERALDNLISMVKAGAGTVKLPEGYDNTRNLKVVIHEIVERLKAEELKE